MWQHRWAVLAGILGASASCLAKIAVDSDSPLLWVERKCHCHLTVDLDAWVASRIYKIAGDLMIRRRINFMPYVNEARIWIQDTAAKLYIFEVDWCKVVMFIPRGALLVAMLVMNAYMLATFMKGMQSSGSVVGTSITTACNFAMSALYGALIWQERFSSKWWIGFSLVLFGVLLLSSVQQVDNRKISSKLPVGVTSRGSDKAVPNSVARKYGQALDTYGSSPRSSIDTTSYSGGRPSLASSNELLQMTAKSPTSTIQPPSPKIEIKPNKARIQRLRKKITALTDRSFYNECPLCEDPLFDEDGNAELALADLSPSCYHILHARCLKYQQKHDKNSNCPICNRTVPMFVNAKQAAHFGGFWIERVEQCLRKLGPLNGDQPQPASAVRDWLRKDKTLTDAQKRYIDDDPTGLGKGLECALEWGGSIDYNDTLKGRKGWHVCLQTRGIWEYSAKNDDIWLWAWGSIHPRNRCDQCQLRKHLVVECPHCQGSAEAGQYCSEGCQKRDRLRHKMTCQMWQQFGPSRKI